MSDLKSEAAALEEQFTQAITDAESLDALEQVRVAALGKKGRVSELMKGLGKMSPDERKEAGPLLNGLKARITDAITTRSRRRAPARASPSGRLHAARPDGR